MPKIPPIEEIRRLLLNPPIFEGQVMRGAAENGRATIRHPHKGTIRATFVGGDLMGGRAAVFSLPGGGYIVTGQPRIAVRSRREGGLLTTPQPALPPVPDPPTKDGAIAVLFRRRDGSNWNFYIAGLTPEPVLVTSIPIVKTTHNVSDSISVSGSDSSSGGEASAVTAAGDNFFLQSSNPMDATVSFVANCSASGAPETTIIGVPNEVQVQMNWDLRRHSPDVSSMSFRRIADFSITTSQLALSGPSKAFEVSGTFHWAETYIRSYSRLAFALEATSRMGDGSRFEGTSASVSSTKSFSVVLDEMYANDAWISPSGSDFVVGVRWDYVSEEWQNIKKFTVTADGTSVTEIETFGTVPDYQNFKADPQWTSDLPDDVRTATTADFFLGYPSLADSYQGISGASNGSYPGSQIFDNPESLFLSAPNLEFLESIGMQPFHSKVSDSSYVVINPSDLIDIQPSQPIQVHQYNATGGALSYERSVSVDLQGWNLLNPESYKRIDTALAPVSINVESLPDSVEVEDTGLSSIGDLVMGIAVAGIA